MNSGEILKDAWISAYKITWNIVLLAYNLKSVQLLATLRSNILYKLSEGNLYSLFGGWHSETREKQIMTNLFKVFTSVSQERKRGQGMAQLQGGLIHNIIAIFLQPHSCEIVATSSIIYYLQIIHKMDA